MIVTRTFCGVPRSTANHQKSTTTSESIWSWPRQIIFSLATISQNLCGGGRWKMWKRAASSARITPTTRCSELLCPARSRKLKGDKVFCFLWTRSLDLLISWLSRKCPLPVWLYAGSSVCCAETDLEISSFFFLKPGTSWVGLIPLMRFMWNHGELQLNISTKMTFTGGRQDG